jgi:CelD/BcsL family acetyltransferase involved in cellulose biosynthesis
MSKLTVEEMWGVNALDALRAEWQVLFKASGAPPFLSWERIAAWQRWLNQRRTPYLLCARNGRRLVGLALLGVEECSLLGSLVKVRRVSLLGEGFGGADYLDVLALPEYAGEAASAIFDHLAERVSFDILELDNLAADSPNLPLLEQRFGPGTDFRYRLTPRFVCPQIELDGDWAAILKQSRRADNFKRRLRQLRACDGFEYRVITQPEESEAAFERFLKLHEAHWTERGGSDTTGHELLRSFHRDVVVRLAEAGLLRFDELWVEGDCRASIYGLDDGQRYCYYNSGYDPAWKNASPGLVLLGLSIENAIERGVRRYDFLRGNEGYKFDWANTTRETVSVLITRRGLPATLFIARRQFQTAARAAAKALAAKDLLPERTVELMRRWRRSRRRKHELGAETPALAGDCLKSGLNVLCIAAAEMLTSGILSYPLIF